MKKPASKIGSKIGGKNRSEYENRVNRVIDHIQSHRSEELTLEALAQVAAFSPFHFHRVFKSITGENLNEFVQRVRLEWAASALTARPQADVTEIALDSGFQSGSAFARAFKERFGMTATQWRQGGALEWGKTRMEVRNLGQANRKPCKDGQYLEAHGADGSGDGSPADQEDEEDTMQVNVTTLPSYRVAYLRTVGPYGPGGAIPRLWERLQRWAAARDLWTADRICLGVAHDNPAVTDPDKCRYDACIVIPEGFTPDAQVNVTQSAGGKYGAAPFKGTPLDIGAAWDAVFSQWLPQSGFQPDDRPCMEVLRGDFVDRETGAISCDLCVPVRPL